MRSHCRRREKKRGEKLSHLNYAAAVRIALARKHYYHVNAIELRMDGWLYTLRP